MSFEAITTAPLGGGGEDGHGGGGKLLPRFESFRLNLETSLLASLFVIDLVSLESNSQASARRKPNFNPPFD